MLVMILRKTPKSLHGELSKWLLEITPGVFAGKTSALVRDLHIGP
ncbi:MAG: type I-E CRISPR-associated endoribonuclease Cas2 [Truepera sp.]|nr:type I-E CRISPR-associated endoribonuclease Cas2 [Truepera sp.]